VQTDDPLFRLVCGVSLALMTAIVLVNVSAGSFALESNTLPGDERVSVATYQDFALIYLTTALLGAMQLRAVVVRAWLYVLAIGTLFTVGARTEFAAILVAIVILEWCLARRRAAMAVLMLLFAVVVGLALQVLVEVSPDNRVVELVSRRSDDDSLQERILMLDSALRTIKNFPLSGKFASYPPGEYAHNILSAWVDLGLAGFLVFAFLLIAPVMDLLVQFRSRAREPLYALALTLLLVDVLLLLTAKFLAYGLTPLALGLYARMRAAVRSAVTQGASRTT
jgi:O-antigen ligase